MKEIQALTREYQNTHSEEIYKEIKKGILEQDKLWIAYSPITQNYYVNTENGKAAAYFFSRAEYYYLFQDLMLQQQIIMKPVENIKEDRIVLFGELYRSGFESIIIDNGQTYMEATISDIAEEPDYTGVQEINVPVTNPLLVRYANLFFQSLSIGRATHEMQNDMFKEIYRGKFLLPIDASGMNTEKSGQDGTVIVKEKSTIRIPMITNSANESFYPVFTDWMELRKYDDEKKYGGLIVKFDDVKTFTMKAGVVVNPFGVNIPIMSNMLPDIEAAGKGEPTPSTEREERNYKVEKGTKVLLGEPREYPQQMVDSISDFLKKQRNVKQAFLKLMEKNHEQSYLIVVDFEGDKNLLFRGIADASMPFLHDKYIDLISYSDDFGKEAVKDSKPFYKKRWPF